MGAPKSMMPNFKPTALFLAPRASSNVSSVQSLDLQNLGSKATRAMTDCTSSSSIIQLLVEIARHRRNANSGTAMVVTSVT